MATVKIGGRSYEVEVKGDVVVVDGHSFPVKVREEQGFTLVKAGDVSYRVLLPAAGERQSGMAIQVDYRPFTVEWEGRLSGAPAPREPRPAGVAATPAARAAVKGGVTAQIAGRVISIKVSVGTKVSRRPTASWPGQSRRASDSVTIATGVLAESSAAVKSRPCRSGSPTTRK